VYLTSLLDRLHPTRSCLLLPNGSTWRCRLSDDEEEVAASCVPEDDGVGVPPTVPEDDEVSGVVDLNHLRASRFCVAALWPFHPPLPLTCKPSVRPCSRRYRLLGSPRCGPSCRGRRSTTFRCCGPSVHGRRWPGKPRCGHSSHCRHSPPGKPRCGASRCGGIGRSRRGGWWS
jgi:hypothetical protein